MAIHSSMSSSHTAKMILFSRLASLLWFLIANICCVEYPGDVHAVVRSNIGGKVRTDRRVMEARRTSSVVRCVAECARIPTCVSVFYNAGSHTCQGHSVNFGNIAVRIDGPKPAIEAPETKYYTIIEGYIGDTCSEGSDCVTGNSECRNGTCLCLPGYSFHPRLNTCAGVCDKYGVEFMEVYSSFIIRNNIGEALNVTLRQCQELCAGADDCRTIDFVWATGDCYLANVTKLDLPADDWYTDDYGKESHLQRDCA